MTTASGTEGRNLIPVGSWASAGQLPAGWEAVCPNPALAPEFASGHTPDGRPALTARGNGCQECFGFLRRPVKLEGGRTYRLQVRLQCDGLQEDLNHHLVHGVFAPEFNNGVLAYRQEGRWITGEERFLGPDKPTDAEIRLYFRFSPRGQVWWEHVSLEECQPVMPLLVRVACSWGKGDMEHWARWLDWAGERKADIALLPEMLNNLPAGQAEPLDGPTGRLLAEKAGQWRMYVSGSFYERRGDIVYNTAPLYDRDGQLVGTYCKNQLYDTEEDEGVTPGAGYPVFHTDFGTVGIIICYDSWFPETTRLLAYKGAEMVLFPNAGYYVSLMPARAADNGVWMVVSSLNCPAGVWDPGGNCGGEMHPDPTRFGPSSFCDFEKNDGLRMITATVDLSRRFSPHYWGGPLRSAPGGRRVRQTLIRPIEDEIAREARRWRVD